MPVVPAPVSVIPFDTEISLFDGFVCGGAVLLGSEERNPEVAVPEAGAEDPAAGDEDTAGEVLALPPAALEEP